MSHPRPWKHTIRIGDIWKNPEMTFEERKTALVTRIRSTPWCKNDADVAAVVRRLATNRTVKGFDAAWNDLYDLADADRVWIDRDLGPYGPGWSMRQEAAK